MFHFELEEEEEEEKLCKFCSEGDTDKEKEPDNEIVYYHQSCALREIAKKCN